MTWAEEAKRLVDEIEKFTNSWEDVPEGRDTQKLAIRIEGLQRLRAAQCAHFMVDGFYERFRSILPSHEVTYGLSLLQELKKIQNDNEA